jgi:hypothetical protein
MGLSRFKERKEKRGLGREEGSRVATFNVI